MSSPVQTAPVDGSTMPQRHCGLLTSGGGAAVVVAAGSSGWGLPLARPEGVQGAPSESRAPESRRGDSNPEPTAYKAERPQRCADRWSQRSLACETSKGGRFEINHAGRHRRAERTNRPARPGGNEKSSGPDRSWAEGAHTPRLFISLFPLPTEQGYYPNIFPSNTPRDSKPVDVSTPAAAPERESDVLRHGWG